jgi:hypothetical protein
MKIACLFFQLTPFEGGINSSRYNKLSKCAIDSFKKFHPDFEIHYVTDENFTKYSSEWKYYDVYDNLGLLRYILAYELMLKDNINKLILLGSDTITCDRLDEFISNNDDVLATLNYPMSDKTEFWETPFYKLITSNGDEVYDCAGLNADVICFNNPEALKRIIDLTIKHFTHFAEQGGLNELAWVDKSFNVKVVDGPYPLSKVSYNARSKGVYGTEMIINGKLAKYGPPLDGTPSPTLSFYVKNKKLFTSDNKQIKVFHYCEGLGCQNEQVFMDKVNDFHTWFNQETKDFFTNECDCGDFFIKQFEI